MNILVVDDNLNSLQNIVKFITKFGHNVDQCESAAKALALLKKHSYQLVFTDIKMPQMSGIDLLKAISEFPSDTKVVLITAHAELETAISAVRYNAFDYLLKPIGIEQLVDVIDKVESILMDKEKKRSLSILLYSKQLFLAAGIRSTLQGEKEINNIYYVTTYNDCIHQAEIGKFDVILVDIDSVEIERCRSLYLKYPIIKVIALTSYDIDRNKPLSFPILRLDNCSHSDLLIKLKSILESNNTSRELSVSATSIKKLSSKEKQILLRVAQGKTNREIARELYLSPTTIRNYVSKILQKLNIPNRTVAALFVSRHMHDKEQ